MRASVFFRKLLRWLTIIAVIFAVSFYISIQILTQRYGLDLNSPQTVEQSSYTQVKGEDGLMEIEEEEVPLAPAPNTDNSLKNAINMAVFFLLILVIIAYVLVWKPDGRK